IDISFGGRYEDTASAARSAHRSSPFSLFSLQESRPHDRARLDDVVAKLVAHRATHDGFSQERTAPITGRRHRRDVEVVGLVPVAERECKICTHARALCCAMGFLRGLPRGRRPGTGKAFLARSFRTAT